MQNMPPMSEVTQQPNRFTRALVKGPRAKIKAKPMEPTQAGRHNKTVVKEVNASYILWYDQYFNMVLKHRW